MVIIFTKMLVMVVGVMMMVMVAMCWLVRSAGA